MLTSVGSIGNTWICDGRQFYYKDGNITKVGSHRYANMRYVRYFIEAPLFNLQVINTVSGTAYNALTIVKILNLIFPLPPLSEQHRIVAKVDELLALCDNLKARLNYAQTIQVQLADAIVQQAVS
jgi:type I restriction enzyme S subunit